MKLAKFVVGMGWEGVAYPFPHTLAEVLGGKDNFAIVHADPDTSSAKLAGSLPKGYLLDFATGAKKHGDFIMSKEPIGPTFWATAEEAVAYGSNLLTPCWAFPPQTISLAVKVVEDGEMGTGDCHGKVASWLWDHFGGEERRGGQFRLACAKEQVLAKGTLIDDGTVLAYESSADLILPVSCFKSTRKPEPGDYLWEVTVGMVAWSEVRPTKFSWQVTQWFSWDAIERDLFENVKRTAGQLLEAMTDTRLLAEYLHLDAKKINLPFLDILLADKHGQLSQHPYVVKRTGEMLRQRWADLALGAGHKFVGLMALPDDSLAFGEIVTSELPLGEVIATRYPLRYWNDLRVWKNVDDTVVHKGVVYMSHETAAALAGDFDGDYFQFVVASEYPALTAEIRSWATRPEAEIIKVKERLNSPMDQESLARVMLSQADNAVGIIAILIGRAAAAGRLDLVPALAQQLQISVDQFKFNLHLDYELLNKTNDTLPKVAWLMDCKNREAFFRRPMYVQSNDTVAQLVRRVNSYWKAPSVVSRHLDEFASLFPEADEKLLALAKKLNQRHGKLINEAMQTKDDDERKSLFKRIYKSLSEWVEGLDNPDEWAAALWSVVHNRKSTGCGSLPFHAFPEQIAAVLDSLPEPEAITIVGLKYHDFANDLDRFDGSKVLVKFALRQHDSHLRMAAIIDDKTLGLVSRETPVFQGAWEAALTWEGQAVYAA